MVSDERRRNDHEQYLQRFDMEMQDGLINSQDTNDYGCLDRSKDPAPYLQFLGFRSSFVPATNEVLAGLYEQQGRVDSEVLLTLVDGAKLSRHGAQLLADAMCHASNSGLTGEQIWTMASQMARISERSPFQFASNFICAGLHIDMYPIISYVLVAEGESEHVVVIRPDHSAEVTTKNEFAARCAKHAA